MTNKPQSEAPSVDTLKQVLATLFSDGRSIGHTRAVTAKEWEQIIGSAEAKINRLIYEAYNKGYSDGRLVKPKYKVGDIAGNYQITERFRRVGKNTKYKVVCILCGAPMFRYSNKFNLKHKECGAIKND